KYIWCSGALAFPQLLVAKRVGALMRLLKQLVALLLVAFRAGKVGGARAANINAVCRAAS
ncbi:hypothetical protein ISX56_31090, partial [Serratia ureilytica]|nr:hypothetical protein [Serratia ureilytica]